MLASQVPKLKKTSGTAAIIAVVSVAVPFLLGTFALAPHLYNNGHSQIDGKVVPTLSFNLFVGTCMSVTAFPVLARIITARGLQKLQLGSMTLACAALNDVVAWALLAVVLAVQKSQSSSGGSTQIEYAPVLIELALIVVVVIVEFVVVQPLMRITVFNAYKRTGSLSPNRLAWVLIGMFLSAWIVHHIGFHSMLGSFTFGLVFPRGYGTPFLYTILTKVEPFATSVLLPLFFMVTGLSIDLSQLGSTGNDMLYILLVASGGKFFGSGIIAKIAGLNWRHSTAIGIMMNTRGLTEIVVLNIAKQAGIIDDIMFTMLVCMAIITTAMAGPLLGLIFPQRQLIKERAADMEANAAAKGKPLNDGVARLVVLVHELQSGAKLLEAAVSTLAPNMRAHLDVAQFSTPGELHSQTEMGTGLLRSPEEVNAKGLLLEQISEVERRGLTSSVTVRTTDEPVMEALVHIHARSPQLVVTDWPVSHEERTRLKELVLASPCTVVLWGGFSPTMAGGATPLSGTTSPAEPDALEPSGSGDTVAVPVQMPPPVTRPPPKPRPTLMQLLRNEDVQDEFFDDLTTRAFAAASHAQAAIAARLPAYFRSDAAALLEDDEPDEESGHGGSAARPGVKHDKSIVTPQTMAVAAASSLSPKFSKLMITGWPANELECAALIKFLHEVEHEVVAQRLSLESRRQPERGGSWVPPEALPAIGEESLAELQERTPRSASGDKANGKHARGGSEDMDSATTVGPMLGKVLGAALQHNVGARKD